MAIILDPTWVDGPLFWDMLVVGSRGYHLQHFIHYFHLVFKQFGQLYVFGSKLRSETSEAQMLWLCFAPQLFLVRAETSAHFAVGARGAVVDSVADPGYPVIASRGLEKGRRSDIAFWSGLQGSVFKSKAGQGSPVPILKYDGKGKKSTWRITSAHFWPACTLTSLIYVQVTLYIRLEYRTHQLSIEVTMTSFLLEYWKRPGQTSVPVGYLFRIALAPR